MKFYQLFLSLLVVGLVFSCKSKDPSVLKIYVRSNNHILTPDATVRLVGDVSEGTPEYFEEKKTDESGVVIFNLDELFSTYEKEQNAVAHFTLYAKDSSAYYTTKNVRAKIHLTSVETIILDD
ncbi:MAG: hypothetical protein COA32_08610 [Fluviicola sp.]|nr:MAG: hypothetical protein COA32_08610 [Fluviicola sp.]